MEEIRIEGTREEPHFSKTISWNNAIGLKFSEAWGAKKDAPCTCGIYT
jgi:hypothetical protein